MHQLINLYHNSNHLHHAYFVVSFKIEEAIHKLKHFLENIVGVNTKSNPDFWHGKFNTFTIEDARFITESSERKSFSPSVGSGSSALPTRKIFIIETDFITEEAQNALLKVFEEPTLGTHFFIVSPQDMLLPTLKSRMQVVFHEAPSSESSDGSKNQSFLKLTMKERLEKVKEITEAIKDEEKTKQDAISFLNQIETELYEAGVEKSSKSLELCQKARASLYDRGAPVKIILENLVLSV